MPTKELTGVLEFYSETGTEGGYWAFQVSGIKKPKNENEYDGFHILKTGDQLTIYDKDDPSKIIWEGKIRLKRHKLFTKHALGFWIHHDQTGFEGRRRHKWARWFLENYPARLIPHK